MDLTLLERTLAGALSLTVTGDMTSQDLLLDTHGRLKEAELLDRLKMQASGFIDFVEKLKAINLRGTR